MLTQPFALLWDTISRVPMRSAKGTASRARGCWNLRRRVHDSRPGYLRSPKDIEDIVLSASTAPLFGSRTWESRHWP